MAKPYRIKHKASGLYYQPTRNHCNLGKNGKVYMTNNSPLLANNGYDYILIDVRTDTKIHKILAGLLPNQCKKLTFYGFYVHYRIPKTEFEKEEL